MDESRLIAGEVADRAGVEESFLAELVGAHIVDPGDGGTYTTGAVRRVQLVSACADAGLSVEAIGLALSRGTLTLAPLDAPHYERWGDKADVTYGQLAARIGVPFEFLCAMQEALGFAAPSADDRSRRDEMDTMPVLAVAYAQGIDPDALIRLFRVYGDGLRRIASAETGLWHEHVDVPLQQAGMSQREVLEAGLGFGEAVMPLMDQALISMYRRMQETAWMADLVEHVQIALEEAGVHERLERPPAMVFADISGYTRLTEEHGDEVAADLATAMADLVQGTAVRNRGQAVKFLGDGVMFYFREAADGLRAALDVVAGTPDAGLPPAHIGLHAGPVVMRDGDVFGRTVNWAARISSQAEAHEVLVSREVIDASQEVGASFESIGSVDLKGIADPVELFRATRG
ncbi:MAG TPA: adenylate/guanylate cyclase domain-containing protein [Actinomycetota bacterium]|jgi:class 3 adenylate cyclase